jgi:hypothetical protein
VSKIRHFLPIVGIDPKLILTVTEANLAQMAANQHVNRPCSQITRTG